jgi:hypothetical protein
MLNRRLGSLTLLACFFIALSLFLLGCGSASSSDYSGEVSAIYRKTNEELNHIFEELNHAESDEEEEAEEALITSLEEAAEVVHKAYKELEKIKVPDGLEDLHKESLALLQSVALSYEEQVAFLEPEEHHEEEGHEDPHDEEEQEDEHTETGEQEEHETGEEPPEEAEDEHEDGNNQGY